MSSKTGKKAKPSARNCNFFKFLLLLTPISIICAAIITYSIPIYLTPVINTASGPVQGSVAYSRSNQKFWQFLGIPFAKPPIGDKKFAPPEPAEPWNNVKTVIKYPPSCARYDILISNKPKGQLDCLYLNVYVNVQDGFEKLQPRPVLVYIYGGGWVTGWTEFQQPDYFMDHNIVMVIMGYRLGPYGFLNISTVPGAPEGNMAMFDQILALKWVQQNIASFGGDPNKVTLFGESAGAMSTEFHILSPLSQGLFHKAILQSASSLAPFAYNSDQLKISRNYAKRMGCNISSDVDVWQCFLNSDAETVVKYQHTLLEPLMPKDMFQITIDNKFLMDTPLNLAKSGNFAKVPIMIGMNSDEGALRAGRFDAMPEAIAELDEKFNELLGNTMVLEKPLGAEVAQKIRRKYFGNKNLTEDLEATKRALNLLFSDMGFFYPPHQAAVYYAKSGVPVHMYYFNYTSRILPGMYGVYEATRLDDWIPGELKVFWVTTVAWINELFFGGKGTRPYGIPHSESLLQAWNVMGLTKYFARWDQDFSKSFVKVIVDFANDTMPLKFRGVEWPTINGHIYSAKDEFSIPYMLMDNEKVPKVIPEPFGERIKFWANLEGWDYK